VETFGATVGILINLGVPVAGVATFLWFRHKIAGDQILQVVFFVIFAHFGAVLVLLLTTLFWYASGMASLGLFYLPTGGSLVMTVLAGLAYYRRNLSPYYRIAFIAAGIYILLMIIAIAVVVFWVRSL